MENEIKENFKKELKSLLEKYDVNIQFECDSSSDTHGITGGRIKIYENKTYKMVLESYPDSWYLGATDI